MQPGKPNTVGYVTLLRDLQGIAYDTKSLNLPPKVSTFRKPIDFPSDACHSTTRNSKGGTTMLNDEFFRQTLEDIINNPENYSKDELYEALLDMTERYLNEMVTSMNLENALTAGMDKESADELIEQIATTNPCINDLDDTNAQLQDRKEVIQNLLIMSFLSRHTKHWWR